MRTPILIMVTLFLFKTCAYEPGENRNHITIQNALSFAQDTLDTTGLSNFNGDSPDTLGVALAQVYLDSAEVMEDSAKYEIALKLARKALNLFQKSVGKMDTMSVKSYNKIAWNHQMLGNIDSSLINGNEAIKISRHLLGEDNLLEAAACMIIANAYHKRGQLVEALEHFERSEKIVLQLLGSVHTKVATCYNSIGMVLNDMGNYNTAIEYIEKAFEVIDGRLDSSDVKFIITYNNLGISYYYKENYSESIKYFEKALKIQIECFGSIHNNVAVFYNNIGAIWSDEGNYNNAISNFKKALKINIEIFGSNYPEVAANYNNIGVSCWRKGDYDLALKNYKEALSIRLSQQMPQTLTIADVYNNMANVFSDKGNYDKAIDYNNKALEIILMQFDSSHSYAGMCYNNLGNCWFHAGDIEKARNYLMKGLQIRINQFGQNHSLVADSYLNIGNVLNEENEFEQSIEYLNKALKLHIDQLGANHPIVAIDFMNIGGTFFEVDDWNQAIVFFEKSLQIRLDQLNTFHPHIALSYLNLGKVEYETKDYQKAINYLYKALGILNKNELLKNDFSEISDLVCLKDVFKSLEACYLNLSHEQIKYQDSLQAHYKKMLFLEEYIQKEYTNLAARQSYLSKSKPVFEGAITNLKLRNKKEELPQTFTLSEKTKSRLLTEAIRKEYNINYSDLPESLIGKEHDMNADISYYEKKKFQAKYETKPSNDSLATIYKNKVFDLKRKRDQLLETLKKNYPNYWNLKYNFEVAGVKEVQKNLKKDQALVEYFIGDSSLFIFIVTVNDFDIEEVKLNFPLIDWVDEMRNGIFAYNDPHKLLPQSITDSLDEQYATRAYSLFKKLLLPIKEYIPDETQLIIVPDGVLNYLAFDALLTQPMEQPHGYRTPHYLLKTHQISYAYSATLWLEMYSKKIDPKKCALALSPSFPKRSGALAELEENKSSIRDSLYHLKHSLDEVAAVENIWNAEVLSDKAANLQYFLKKAADYRILHLSTHGKAHDRLGDYCFLAFTKTVDSLENLLYTRDLYNMQLNAEMVVLSACETGLGELQKGEGLLSLARGFAYAGTKSIISTLWSVNEMSTKEIMEVFYTNLKKGMQKDEALRHAKLTYLKKGTKPQPYYWAAFTAVGDMNPIQQEPPKWYYIGALVLFGIILILIKRLLST